MRSVPRLELEDVRKILAAAQEEAVRIGVDMDIAVVDDGGNLLGFYRMDRAKITSIQIAIDKAFTAAGTRKNTKDYKPVGAVDGMAFGINSSNQGRFVIYGGGVPIFLSEECVGAVGCSSGTPEQDEQVARAGIQAFLKNAEKKSKKSKSILLP